MSQPVSPLALPAAWDGVSAAYVEDVVPVFSAFADDALRFADLRAGEAVLDVASGPGTLALAAAKHGAHVTALDFSTRMIDALRARAAREGLTIDATVGDGQSLPYDGATFDAAFSMFGLMFFPDRVRGLRELHRVLRPGGRAVVSSWQAMERVPILAAVFGTIRELLPGVPFGAPKAPLVDAAAYHDEMGQAGFRDVEVREVVHGFDAASPAAFWETSVRSNAAVVVLREKLGAAWDGVDARVRAKLREAFGEGTIHVSMPANLALARA